MNDNIIEQIRDGVDILELVKEYVPAIKKAGRTYKACCPFHQEKTPSFTISPDKGLFYCFGCQTGGDVFAFLMKIENLSFNEAARKLAERAGVQWRKEEAMSDDEKHRLKLYKIMDFAAQFYHKQLMSTAGEAARAYIKNRSLTKETAQKFTLGCAAFEGLTKAAAAAGHSLQDLKTLGLASATTGTDYFKNRLMFPIFNHRAEAVAFGGRVMGEGQPKYLNSPQTPLFDKSRVLYALNFAGPAIRKEGCAILLEGYMDVIAAHQAGVENCVAPLGTSFTDAHAKLLKRYASDIVVVFDPDSAGINAALRAALILVENGLYVRVLTLPEDMDPDEYITARGPQAFRDLTGKAKDIINFQADLLLKGKDQLTPQDKTNIAARLVETIQKQADPIIKQEWARLVADRLGIEGEIIFSKVAQKTAAQQPQTKAAAPQIAAKDTPQQELDLIKTLLKYPRYISECANLTQAHFKNNQIWLILKEIEAIKAQNPTEENISPMLAQALPAAADLVLRLSVAVLPASIKPAQEIQANVNALEKALLTRRLKDLQQKIAQYPSGSVPLETLKEKIELEKQLKSLN
ncbi:MAG: DNA primase [Elusimicrobiota bacterium]|nr:DNA primase [Elusimicrobiota bacterium]